ncbi:LysM peptidoglycan-binding domain-containing protein [Ammoniphilus sp. 3BR4]|uniref:LysM peptidoglycan-binding domain-containing protein n=1 Tax=Ammoniphilus sp. 3BR4 TaxID=3158265 RepID=UPI0034654F73
MQIHVVQHGETLWLLSRRYGVPHTQIAAANELPDPNRLAVGQALVIPMPDRFHVVQPGESLWVIARKYGTTVQAIVQANGIPNPSLIFPGLRLTLPPKAKPPVEVNAYVEKMFGTGQQLVREVGKHLTYLSPFSYQVRRDGSIQDLKDTEVLQTARAERVAPLMTITNFEEGMFRSELAHAILASTEIQDRLTDNILNTMRNKGYIGLNIDFEYVFEDDRELYNQFIRRAASRLQSEGFLISSALAPKLYAGQKGRLYEAHDYPVHGEVLDFVVLMTYEWGWSGGPPMAVAPINQVRKVLDYAVSVIPSRKIMMGMPLYGYDWTLPYVQGGPWALNISPQEAVSRAIRYNAAIQYDQAAQSPFFHYYDEQGREHEVWFEDARSVQAKFDTVKQYNLRGVSYWVLGNPFPQNWLVLEDNFEVVKFDR